MGALAVKHLVSDIQDPGQQLHQRAVGLRSPRHHRRSHRMEPHGDICLEFSGHHPAGVAAQFRYRRTLDEARGDVRGASECHLWQRRGIDRENGSPEASTTVLMGLRIGQHRGTKERRDPHRAVEHAGLDPFEHPARPGLLLPRRWHQTQPTVLQLDRGINYVVADGCIGGVPHHPRHALCGDGEIGQTRGR